jgi:DNA-binding response OmpR family regulator
VQYNSSVATHTLETHIYRLRQKMEADPSNPRLLRTGHNAYRLDATATSATGAERELDRTH